MEKIPSNQENILSIYGDFINDFNCPKRESYISYFDLKRESEVDENSDEKNKSCILVGLREKLPAGLELPDQFKGVRIYTK